MGGGVKSLKVAVKCLCPMCKKEHTREKTYGYSGPAKLAPIFCFNCKIISGHYNDDDLPEGHARR